VVAAQGIPVIRSGFFASHRTFAILLVATGIVWAALEIRQSLNRRTGARIEDRGSLGVIRLISIVAALAAALVARAGVAVYPVTTAVLAVALALVWAGILLRQWCFRTLGRYFTFTVMTSPDQRVVTTGPYRVLRHPSYAAILLILTGIGLTYGSWLSLACLVVIPAIGFWFRIRVEEAALSRALGAAYLDYAKGRKRIIPFVW
jgi:protein-S-isoprenylcysteine O-methyltransferase Ste14